MAKKKAPRRRRQVKSMFNLVTLGKALFTLNATTRYFAGANLGQFLMGQKVGSTSAGYGNYLSGNSLSFLELIGYKGAWTGTNTPVMDQIKANMNREGALAKYITENIAIQVLPQFLKAAGINRSFNTLAKQTKMNKFVKMGGN